MNMESHDNYHPASRLLWSLAAASLIVRLTLVAVALASVAIGLVWVWP